MTACENMDINAAKILKVLYRLEGSPVKFYPDGGSDRDRDCNETEPQNRISPYPTRRVCGLGSASIELAKSPLGRSASRDDGSSAVVERRCGTSILG